MQSQRQQRSPFSYLGPRDILSRDQQDSALNRARPSSRKCRCAATHNKPIALHRSTQPHPYTLAQAEREITLLSRPKRKGSPAGGGDQGGATPACGSGTPKPEREPPLLRELAMGCLRAPGLWSIFRANPKRAAGPPPRDPNVALRVMQSANLRDVKTMF